MNEFLFTRKNQKTGALENCGRMQLSAKNDSAVLDIYGDICSTQWEKWFDDDRTPQDVSDFLKSVPADKQLEVHINSGGGDVFAGIAIYNLLKNHTGHTTVYVDGLAASIASVVMLAGDEIVVRSGAQVMIHEPWSMVAGNAAELRKTAEALDGCKESILDIYCSNAQKGVTREKLADLMAEETWMRGDEASQIFRLTVDQTAAAAACASDYFGQYKNCPIKKPDPAGNPENNVNQEKEELQAEIDFLSMWLF